VVTIVEASAERWDDLAELMGERGEPARCWCQYYRSDAPYQHASRDRNRELMREQVTTATVPHGVLAYDADRAVGWCAVAPRADYPRLVTMRAAQATHDEEGLWAITCFVVRVGYRRRGIAAQLLAGAVAFAVRNGARVIEAYPIDPSIRPTGSAGLYQGPLSMYQQAGFTEVARPSANRAIVRLAADRAGR
jgi:GNAT superfamily N-acetyltransferase